MTMKESASVYKKFGGGRRRKSFVRQSRGLQISSDRCMAVQALRMSDIWSTFPQNMMKLFTFSVPIFLEDKLS